MKRISKSLASIILLVMMALSLASILNYIPITHAETRPTLVIGLPDLPANGFNPLNFKMVYTQVIADAMFEPLVRVRWDGNGYIPNLAASWETKDDGKVWIFHLIHNATWHDGKPVTADDVVYTYQLIKKYQALQGGREDFIKKLVDVKKIDDYTVEFDFSSAPVNALVVFSGVYIVPKHIWETLSDPTAPLPWSKLIGCGPFMYKSSSPTSIILVAYDKHFRGAPEPKELQFVKVSQFVAKLVAGEIDAGYFTTYKASDVKQLAELAAQGKVVLYKTLGSSTHMLIFNMEKPPMNFLAFRMAVAFAINVTRIIEKYYGNLALPGNQALLNPKGYNWTLYIPKEKIYPCNKTLAREILIKALGLKPGPNGLLLGPDGKPIHVKILAKQNDVFCRDLIAKDIAADLRSIGIDAEAYIVPASQFGSVYNARQWDMVIVGWFLPDLKERYGKPPVVTFGEFTTGSDANVPKFSNATYDKLYQEFKTAVENKDWSKAYKLAWEMQMILVEQIPAVSLYHPYVVTAARIDKYKDWVFGINLMLNYYSYVGASKFGLKGPAKFHELSGQYLLSKVHMPSTDEMKALKDWVLNHLVSWGVLPKATATTTTTTTTTTTPPQTTTTTPPASPTTTTTTPTQTPTTTPSQGMSPALIAGIIIVIIIIIAIIAIYAKKK